MENKVIYLHLSKDTNEVFYVGIGNKIRPNVKTGRNKYWRNFVKKHGYTVQIIKENVTIEDACELEKELIAKYKSIGQAKCNISSGGDSYFGFKHSEDIKDKIRKSQIGEKNSKAKKVIDINTGKTYGTIKQAAEELGIKKKRLSEKLRGVRKNNTSIRYLTES